MKFGILLSVGFWAAMATLMTGCAGMEVGGRLGVYRVDEQQNTSRTYQQNTKPLLCMFKDCSSSAKPRRYGEEQGS